MCNVVYSKRINKLPDSIVSVIFSKEGSFSEKNLKDDLNMLATQEQNCCDESRIATNKEIEDLIHYTLKSFLQSDRVECIGNGKYKVKMAY